MLDKTITDLPPAVYIRERLGYDPETGVFVWRHCPAKSKQWNARDAGTVAGSVNCVSGYRLIRLDGRMHFAHRIAWIIVYGEWPGADIDHINGDRDDNRIVNLRSVNRVENMRNQAIRSTNTSGHMGACWHKARGKWHAYITANGSRIFLGWFATFEEAVAARKSAEMKYGFHANHGRAGT